MQLTQYRQDPCGSTSIPWWKQQRMTLPHTMKILHHRDYSPEEAEGYREQVYFRLFHSLKEVPVFPEDGIRIEPISVEDACLIASFICSSYPDIRVTEQQVRDMARSAGYCPELWIAAYDRKTGAAAGCILGEFDPESGEMSIEWLQVLPRFRRQGIGTVLVARLLAMAPAGAGFATVSGRVDNETKPEALYRRCGFTGNDLWHIFTKEN